MSVTWNAVGSDKSLLDITEEIGDVATLMDERINVVTGSMTFNNNGNVATALMSSDWLVLGAFTTSNTTTVIRPYIGASTGQWWLNARKASDDSKVTGAHTVTIFYVKRPTS